MNGTQAYVLSLKRISLLGTAAYLDAGVANGVATLDDAGKVPSMQLPSYVDDVLEYDTMADFPEIGESGKIYVDKSTNKSYRWSGSTYIFSGSDLALGETSTTAYRGDRGKAAYDHSLLTSGNPHNVTKGDLGLGNVENKSSSTIRSELTKSNVTTALGYTPPTVNTTYTFAAGDNNGQIKVTPSGGTAYNVDVKGLGALAYKDGLSKSDVGLGNVENKSSSTIRSELTKSNVTTALGYTPPTVNTTYTFESGTNKFTVTPLNGEAIDVSVTPSIENNITGSGASGYIAKFNGTNTITNGPKFGNSTTTYLTNKGTWATPPNDNTTYSFTGGTNKFTVTPLNGEAIDVSVTPSIENNITGLGTSGYIAKFNGTNTITNGPAFGNNTTKYLRNDGNWVVPPNDNTTYQLKTGSENGTVKLVGSDSTSEEIAVKGLGALAFEDSLTYSDVGAAPASHNHNDIYYTETEIDTKLSGKSDTSHTHDSRYYTETEINNLLSDKSNVGHTHDDRYYNKSETDNLLSGKSDTGHKHDDRYYTESEVNSLLSGKSDTSHTHDDRYYTETEVNNLLNGKSNTGHTHDDRYYTETEVNNLLNGKSNTGHTHDDRYYTESEVNSLLSGKSDVGHTHSYLPLSGGTLTGDLLMANSQSIIFSNDTSTVHAPFIKYGSNYTSNHIDINASMIYFSDGNISSGNTATLLFAPGKDTSLSNDFRLRTNSTTLTLNGGNYVNIGANVAVQCRNAADTGWVDLNCRNVNQNSSRRYKTNIEDLTVDEALKVLQLRPVSFDYIDGRPDQRGLIAEEVESLIPGSVSYTEIDGTKVPDGLSYTTFIPYLVKMIQMQQEEINELKAKLN